MQGQNSIPSGEGLTKSYSKGKGGRFVNRRYAGRTMPVMLISGNSNFSVSGNIV